ncbi:MAG: hypothetical protein F9K47_04825 [Burkholderiales bacterium]|nr:MAG: hypothetical protein F9K47_04825 [Burkholderiales bacterium]
MAQETRTFGRETRAALLARLMSAARAAAAAARGLARGLGILTLLSALAALWVAYALASGMKLAPVVAGLILVLLLVPVFVLGLMGLALRELMAVPPRLQAVVAKLKGGAQGMQEAVKHPTDVLPQGRWAALKEFAKVLLELRSLGGEVAEVFVVLRGAALVANPAFALIALVSVLEGVVLIVVAGAVALVMAF